VSLLLLAPGLGVLKDYASRIIEQMHLFGLS